MSQPNGTDPAWERVGRLAEVGVMTASLLHEIRQPLFAIKALVELEVAQGGDRPGHRLRRVLDQVEVMEQLLGNYGLLGRQDDDPALFDVEAPIGLAVDMLGHKARQMGAKLRHTNGGAPAFVYARRGAVRQILVNLIHNAIDAVSGRAEREVDVEVGHDEVGLVVEVRDTGGGISEEMTGRVFEPFVTTKPEGHGTGLGLYIARSLAREAGGELEIRVTGDSGTVVRLRLPRASSPDGG
jgi:two-component system C4-dicarboxylate transport sensor histidine kinase DctB